MVMQNKSHGKLLGDAGEYYALSQLGFAGKYAAKMPDNWEAYDLAVETGQGLVRVSVKTRSEGPGWKGSKWFNFDDRKECDWLVLVFKAAKGPLRSWVIPYGVALSEASVPGPKRKDPWSRDLSWTRLNKQPLVAFEDNWSLKDYWEMFPERAERFSLDLSGVVWSQCVFCKHKHAGSGTCDAFPDGIPGEILTNDADHREYFPGDQGIRYEQSMPDNNFWDKIPRT